MKPVLLAFLLLPVTNALFAQTKISKASVEQILMQMERDWSQADVKKRRGSSAEADPRRGLDRYRL